MSCTRVMNSVIQRSSNAGMVVLVHLICGELRHLTKIRAVDPTTQAEISGMSMIVDMSINPRMALQEGYDTQVLVVLDYATLFPPLAASMLHYKLQMSLSLEPVGAYADISFTAGGLIPEFSLVDVVVLNINVGVRDTRPGDNSVPLTQPPPPASAYYEILYYNPPTPATDSDELTLVCTIGVTGGTPDYSVNVYETEEGPLTVNASEPANALQGVSAAVDAATSTVGVYYDAARHPVYGRNHNMWTVAYVSISDALGHAFQVPLKIFAYTVPAFASPTLTYSVDNFGSRYSSGNGDVAASPQLHNGTTLLPSTPISSKPQFLLGTFETTCLLDAATVLSVADVDAQKTAGYSVVPGGSGDSGDNAYSVYYGAELYSPGFPAGHFSASISIAEYGREFPSTCAVDAYIYRRLQIGEAVTGRDGATVLVADAVTGIYGDTFYYPEKDEPDGDGRILVASFTVSGGLVLASDEHTATASVVSTTLAGGVGGVGVSVDVAARAAPSTSDTSTIRVYVVCGTQPDAGRGNRHANIRVQVAGSCTPDVVTVELRAFSYSNPAFSFAYDDTNFNLKYVDATGPRAHAATTDAVDTLLVGRFVGPVDGLLPGAVATLQQPQGATGNSYTLQTDYRLTYTGGLSADIRDGVSIHITENGLAFSAGNVPGHYIYRALHAVHVLDSRGDAVSAAVTDGTYSTVYYPSHVSLQNTAGSDFTVDAHGLLVGTYVLAGGKGLAAAVCTLNTITTTVVAVAVDAATVRIYLVSDGSEAASRDRSVYGHIGFTVSGVFVSADTNVPECITPGAFKVFAVADPSFGLVFDTGFTRVYGTSQAQAQALAHNATIGPGFPLGAFTMESAVLADAVTFDDATQHSRGLQATGDGGSVTCKVLYTPTAAPFTGPSYDLRVLSLRVLELGLAFAATATYFIYPQISVAASVQRYVPASELGACRVTVTTQHGLGDYTLDLSAISAALQSSVLMSGFSADRDVDMLASFTPASASLSISPGADTSTSTQFSIVLHY